MNKLPADIERRVVFYIKQGLSHRRIAGLCGISRNTVERLSHEHRSEYPKCLHGKPIVECSSCFGRRRTTNGRDILWVASGPRPKEFGSQQVGVYGAAEVLSDAIGAVYSDLLEEKKYEQQS